MSVQKKTPTHIQFISSGISGVVAALCMHPLDLLKNRMQMSGVGDQKRRTVKETALFVYRKEGIVGFYQGVTAGMFRQATYGSARLGTYLCLMNTYKEKYDKPPELYIKILLGSVCGITGSLVGTPAEVALVRMTTDGLLKPELRRNYSNVLSAIFRIAKEENVSTLWRGLSSTMTRAMVANAAELSSYSQSKQFLISTAYFTDNITTHFLCSLTAALVNITFSLPLDIAKTRIQNMKTEHGEGKYKGPADVIFKVVKHEGVTALWKGFVPSFACIGPRTILIFIFVEYLNKKYRVLVLKETKDCSGL